MTRPYTPWLLLLLALALAAVYLFPLYWMYVTSIKSASEIYANPPTFWPLAPDFSIYPSVSRAFPAISTRRPNSMAPMPSSASGPSPCR